MKKRKDLHIHTICSDGALTPVEVIDMAVKNGVDIISITDHDTIDAYSKELFAYAEAKYIELIPGIEITSRWKQAGIHVLGYDFDWKSEKLKNTLEEIRKERHTYLFAVAKKLKEQGYLVDTKKLDQIDAVTKGHIAQDVVSNPENEKQLLKDYSYIPLKGEFIETMMNSGCPSYVKKKKLTVKEAADLIRTYGGKVVLAHPVAYLHQNGLTVEDIGKIVDEMEPDGIEAEYLYIDRKGKCIDERKSWRLFAEKRGLAVTTGSDFHRYDGLHPEIGELDKSK